MSEISKAMNRSNREQGRGDIAVEPGRVVSPVLTSRINHGDCEQYLSLASEVALALPGVSCRAVLFSSAVTGEGVSTVSREFAATVAERGDVPTILIDANLRSPSVHDVFRLRRDPGLTDHIVGGVPLSDCICETSVPRLKVMTSGRPVIAPPRVTGDERTAAMISELRGSYRFIVIDAPPILSFSEGVQLSGVSDGVVMVVRSGHTRRQLHAHALDLLEGASANILGTVLNRRRFYIPRFVYDRM